MQSYIRSRRARVGALAFVFIPAIAGAASTANLQSQRPDVVAAATASQTWKAWGGEVGFRFNTDLLENVGLSLDSVKARRDGEYSVYPLADSDGLTFDAPLGTLKAFTGGKLTSPQGFVLRWNGGSVDMRGFSIKARAGGADPMLDVVDAKGNAYFYVDHMMYELTSGQAMLNVPTMDIRIAPALAKRIGRADLANMAIADMRMRSSVIERAPTAKVIDSCASPNWPNSGGGAYIADVSMEAISAQQMRCRTSAGVNGCDGLGADDGEVVFAPNSTLRNSADNNGGGACTPANPCAAEVAWYTKFSGQFPPYNNDQHPYLIWNLYRVDASGKIEQIGRSGVKHAFLTINSSCAESCGDSHILGRGCGDTYSTGNNDSNGALGPRSEIIPATGQWGRCGSIYDVNCDGAIDSSGNTNYSQRLIVRESQIQPSLNTGAQYFFESWYIVRDDVNIYNTHGSYRVAPSFGSTWTLPAQTAFKTGAVIDTWVDPSVPTSTQRNVELVAPEGHAKVAVRVTDLGNGSFRYDYAVMNFDFARAVIDAAHATEPNLKVLSNLGFGSFSIPLPAGATVSAIEFGDGDVNAGNNWTSVAGTDKITWTAPTGNELNWGTLYRFSFTVDAQPTTAVSTLGVATTGTPSSYDVNTLGPQAAPPPPENLIISGFEDGE